MSEPNPSPLPPELQPTSDTTREMQVIDFDFAFEASAIKALTVVPERGDQVDDLNDYYLFRLHDEDGQLDEIRIYKRTLAWDSKRERTLTIEVETTPQSPAAVARQDLSSPTSMSPAASPAPRRSE